MKSFGYKVAQTIISLLFCACLSVPVYGYFNNIALLLSCDFEASYKAEAVRTLGVIFPPVGVIAGFCELGK